MPFLPPRTFAGVLMPKAKETQITEPQPYERVATKDLYSGP